MAEAQDDQEHGEERIGLNGTGLNDAGLNDAGSSADRAPSGDPVTDTLLYVARALVAHPDEVRVEPFEAERSPGYRLHVHPDDVGRVIGRGGRVARSIRMLAKTAAARAGTHAFIEIGG